MHLEPTCSASRLNRFSTCLPAAAAGPDEDSGSPLPYAFDMHPALMEGAVPAPGSRARSGPGVSSRTRGAPSRLPELFHPDGTQPVQPVAAATISAGPSGACLTGRTCTAVVNFSAFAVVQLLQHSSFHISASL